MEAKDAVVVEILTGKMECPERANVVAEQVGYSV
jgi:hypothetical protein